MKRRLLLLLMTLLAMPAGADVVVATGNRPGTEALSREEVTNIFMGRFRTLPSGLSAQPIDQPADSPLRRIFYQRLVDKDPAGINAYWSRLYFSGKASPPIQASSPEQVIEFLASQPGAIGYVERSQLDRRLRIVFEFPP